jgi:hypothetical protein
MVAGMAPARALRYGKTKATQPICKLSIDRAVKLELYAHYRVPEYWIVNPIDLTVEVYTLQEQNYLVAGIYEPGETVTAGLFAEGKIAVDTIFGQENKEIDQKPASSEATAQGKAE